MKPQILVNDKAVGGIWVGDVFHIDGGGRIDFSGGTWMPGDVWTMSESRRTGMSGPARFRYALDPQTGNRHERRARAAQARKR